MASTDIQVKDVSFDYVNYKYRTPIKFGGVALDNATILNVHLTVETTTKQIAYGHGSMPLSNVWAWPTTALTYDETLDGMKIAIESVAHTYLHNRLFGHPIEITHQLEHAYLDAARAAIRRKYPGADVPDLATYVSASSFDAALHDAYGKAHGLNCYKTYGRDFLRHDIGHFLGKEYSGLWLENFVSREPKPRMPLYHLVGAVDPVTPSDVKTPVGDGLPEHLAEWITSNGLTHIKIKLNGDDIGWDVERVVSVNTVAETAQANRGVATWCYSLDFNEKCKDVQYLLEFLHRLKARTPAGFERVQYIEQPTSRNLKARHNPMHEAAVIRPVVIDEALTNLETLLLSREQGYTGVAFKACKGQTQTLLLAAVAQHFNMFRCVQDLTCPGASLIQSASIAAHIPGVAAIEANSRQYCPAANQAWDARFPGVFTIRDGSMNTSLLTGKGLGAVE